MLRPSLKVNASVPLLFPLPKLFTHGSTARTILASPTFFKGVSHMPRVVWSAIARYQSLCFPHGFLGGNQQNFMNPSKALTQLSISMDSFDDSAPQIDTDESYELNVGYDSATLHAKTPYGVLRGLETFSQLVSFDYDRAQYLIENVPWSIKDAPRFPHRGLMIDTGRHYLPISVINDTIDSLVYAKLNVLHWHMVDSQSFPLQIKSWPHLWKGAFSPSQRYLQADVEEVVQYAHLRGVRVMVEFDMPGHAQSWCTGYPEVCPSELCTTPLNVASNKTWELVGDLLQEMTGGRASEPGNPSPGLFKDNFIHLGGDEVNTGCWPKTKSIAKWLRKHNMSAEDAYGYFSKRAAEIAIAMGHRPVQWSEVYDHFQTKLNKKTVVHIWKSNTNVSSVLANGYEVILNVGYWPKSWYLDNLDINWTAVYSNEPCTNVPDSLCGRILGGHGEMWGENVDASDLESTVWPRMAAIAERLWSPREVNSADQATPRMESFRCLLNSRGVRAAPVLNKMARSAPPGPGSCYEQ